MSRDALVADLWTRQSSARPEVAWYHFRRYFRMSGATKCATMVLGDVRCFELAEVRACATQIGDAMSAEGLPLPAFARRELCAKCGGQWTISDAGQGGVMTWCPACRTLACAHCGADYLARPRDVLAVEEGRPRCCSRACLDSTRLTKNPPMPDPICEGCGRPFTYRRSYGRDSNRFCSRTCAFGGVRVLVAGTDLSDAHVDRMLAAFHERTHH